VPGSPAQHAGIKPGDIIREVDGTKVYDFQQLPEIIGLGGGRELAVTLDRNGRELTFHITPQNTRQKVLGNTEDVPRLGVGLALKVKPVIYHYGPVGAFSEALNQTWLVITSSLKGMKQVVLGTTSTSQLHGTVSIVVATKNVAQMGILALIQLIALLSVSIGLINLFPIPVLDGGHLLYYGCEAVLGHPLGERAQEVGFRFGLALVLGLMIFSFWNDLTQHLNLF
jgi:regulator of sigma E protease